MDQCCGSFSSSHLAAGAETFGIGAQHVAIPRGDVRRHQRRQRAEVSDRRLADLQRRHPGGNLRQRVRQADDGVVHSGH